jgi:hypothetical protein
MEARHDTKFTKNINQQINEISKKNKFGCDDATNYDISHVGEEGDDTIIIKYNNVSQKCAYEYLGSYDVTTHVWYWAWGHYVSENKIELSKKIIIKINNMINKKDPKYELTNIDIEYLNYFTQNAIFLSKHNLNKLIKLCIMLLHDDIVWIVPQIKLKNDKSEQINFFIVTKIMHIE